MRGKLKSPKNQKQINCEQYEKALMAVTISAFVARFAVFTYKYNISRSWL